MQSQTLKRYLVYSLVVASFALTVAIAKPQERKALPKDPLPIVRGDCPHPIALTLTATSPNVVASDFSAAQLALPRAWLNDTAPNKAFLYSFQWRREERCCQITKAVLTVKMRANQGGQSATSSDAGNDGIAIMHAGSSVYSEAVYSSIPKPFTAGQAVTKQWTLNPAVLNILNGFGGFGLYVQDDTRVESATLQLWGCCLTGSAPQSTDYSTQSECEEHEKAPCSLQYGSWHRTN
jgi:hypothetical protein